MKKISFILLAALLVVSLLPVSVAAAENRLLEPGTVYKNDAPASVDTVEEKVDWIAQQCRDSGLTDAWEIALWLHNWIIYNAEYDETYMNYSAAGVLLKGTGVCDSYSKAYAMLLNEFGIENRRLLSLEMNHSWNLVKLNGQWCHIDCTWDDPVMGGITLGDYWFEGFRYFGLSDDQMRQDHTWDTGEYPACTSEVNNFSKQSSCGPNAAWRFDKETETLTVSGTGDILWCPWIYAASSAEAGSSTVYRVARKLVIEPGITGIGWGAFYNSGFLGEITIPNTVTAIGSSAFRSCGRLKEVTIPNGVTVIGNSAFRDCSLLTTVTIPNSTATIGRAAFSDCWSLADVHYGGPPKAFDRIQVGQDNEPLLQATLHFGEAPTNDLNDDGVLTTDDAVYLLLHVMFGGEDYPIAGQTDMNGDGSLTTDDAVYLLLHVMFGGEDYPLTIRA